MAITAPAPEKLAELHWTSGVSIYDYRSALRYLRTTQRSRIVVGGLASVIAYSMVLAAVRLAPVGYVASLRESSVVLGAAAGWLFLHERLGRARVLSSVVVAAGLILLIASR